ncbi:PASTA domain-containing protein [Streptomyces sp. NPDC049813]|uniref:PASTA domain-containing protein n=1 Tax=Streptomyces sp. NPDC049813 TaxID=3365597 RepID=UPI0037B132A0
MHIPPENPPEVRVPKLVGLMAVDARGAAEDHGVRLAAPDRPDFPLTTVDYVVRQYPPPGTEVPRDATVTIWFDLGEGGGGVRVPREPGPRGGGLRRELDEPAEPAEPEPAGPAAPFTPCP